MLAVRVDVHVTPTKGFLATAWNTQTLRYIVLFLLHPKDHVCITQIRDALCFKTT